MIRRLAGSLGWLLDSLTRYVPDCAPIKFDDERLDELNLAADLASVEYGPEHPLGRVA
jgi:hypothetical protein